MRITSQDRKLDGNLDPTNISHYLRARGWRRLAAEEGRYSLWATLEGNREAEILVPLNQRFADYQLRVEELLSTLEQLEKRPQAEILEEVHNVLTDVFSFRTNPAVATPGTIPLDEGVRLVTAARDMLMAAANAEHEPRLYFTRPSREAEEVIRKALFGQTRRSSYVITALIPVPPSLQLTLDESFGPVGIEPFERRLGIRLLSSLEALVDAAVESAERGSMEPIEQAVRYGVSLNLCRAVVEAQPGFGSLEISGRWAAARPTPTSAPDRPNRQVPPNVEFQQPVLQQVQAAVSTLGAALPQEGVRVYGHVEELEQPKQEELWGEVRIAGFAENEQRRVRVRLPREPYHQAIAAHQKKQLVSVVGRLVRKGTRYHLEEARDFLVVNEKSPAEEPD